MAVKRVVEAPLWAHVLALCVLLVAASWFVGVDGIVTVDEGSYSTQARAVAEGSWNVPWRFEAIDPTGEWYPFPGSSVGPRGFFPYARQPLFVTVLAGGWMAAGSFGMHLAPLAGYVLACLAAALVAGWAGPGARRWSFWICAASPLLVDGWILWGHSLVAAVAGFGLVALVARTDGARGRGWEVAALAGAACAGVIASLLRADGALVCLGLVAVAGCRWWPTGRWRALGAAAAVLLPSVGALLLQRIWIAAIVGGDGGAILSDRTGGSSWIGGRIKGAWYSLLEPVLRPARNDAALVVLGVAAVVLAGWAGWQLRDARGDATRRVVIALAVASLLTVGRLVLNDDELITGLFPAWPAAAFIVGALVRSRLPTQARLLVVYAAVVAIGIIATQYPDGGSLQWGGRFFSGLVVPLAALGAWIVSAAGAERAGRPDLGSARLRRARSGASRGRDAGRRVDTRRERPTHQRLGRTGGDDDRDRSEHAGSHRLEGRAACMGSRRPVRADLCRGRRRRSHRSAGRGIDVGRPRGWRADHGHHPPGDQRSRGEGRPHRAVGRSVVSHSQAPRGSRPRPRGADPGRPLGSLLRRPGHGRGERKRQLMEKASAVPVSAPAAVARGRRSTLVPLAAGVLLLLTYMLLSFLNDTKGNLSTDVGGKVATLEVMQQDGTAVPGVGYWAAQWDPEGRVHGLYYTSVVDGTFVNVTTLPVIELARPLFAVAGYRGALLWSMLGAVAAAFAARALAVRAGADRRRAWWAFWLTGLASPVLIYALDLWEHAPGLGLMSWGVVAMVDAAQGRARWTALAAGLAFGSAFSMRTEAAAYGFAVVGVGCLLLWRRRGLLRAVISGALASVGFVAMAAANYGLEVALLGASLRTDRASGTAAVGGSGLGVRLKEAVTTTVGMFPSMAIDQLVVGGLMVLLLAWAVWRSSRPGDQRIARIAAAGAVVLFLLRSVDGLGFVPGFLVTGPFGVVALVLVTDARVAERARDAVLMVVLALPIVWMFQFTGGAIPQWGGRYVLTSGLVLTAVGIGVSNLLDHWVRKVLIGLAVGIAVFGLAWMSYRTHEVARSARDVAVVDGPVVSSAEFWLRQLGAVYRGGHPVAERGWQRGDPERHRSARRGGGRRLHTPVGPRIG